MPKPIFIIGNQRSGTTWLANILCQHSKIVGVQSEPFGIRESYYFNIIDRYFGNLKNDNNFNQFIDVFSSSDYFILTKVDKDIFYKERPTNYVQSFKLLMNTFAEKNNAEFWLEKTPGHTLYLNKLSKYFKTASFIGIKRDIVDILKSAVRRNTFRNNRIKKLFILRRVLQYYKYDKHLNKFNSISNRILLINYEFLRKNPKKIISKVCQFLNIEFESSLLTQHYEKGTSFSSFDNKFERERVLTKFEIKMVRWLSHIFRILPYIFYRILYSYQLHIRPRTLPLSLWRDSKRN